MNRRRFLASAVAAALAPWPAYGQDRLLRFADMHSHAGVGRRIDNMRALMSDNGILIVARCIATDRPVTHNVKGRISVARAALPGELAANFETRLARLHETIQREGLTEIVSAATLEHVLAKRLPAAVIAAEGGDFLEGNLQALDAARKDGLIHLQLVHFRLSEIGDISTEAPRYDGLSTFGRDVVTGCNRLGILVDVAHGTSALIEQTLDLSTQPIIYSHGQASSGAPHFSQRVTAARAIHLPVARKIAQKGGVVGIWANGGSFPTLERYADALIDLADNLSPAHVGVGTDMNGMSRMVVPTYREYFELAEVMTSRGVSSADLDMMLGGNYIRVLKSALAAEIKS
ncbi:MAG: membrane dipeptidase [Burkholderiales bacterium]